MEKKLINAEPRFSNGEWCSGANNWEYIEESSCRTLWQDEAASLPSLLDSIIVFEENANVVSHAFVDPGHCVPTAEIEPDENEPITLDSPVVPTCNLTKLLTQKSTSPQVCNQSLFNPPP